ncbi:alpha-1,6-mannosyltransferase [Lithohypha guttulata]|uniref:alpha-1,6-mannosyltransferase n=1 Tax=Lithohypha guttulata TaxID=1690604 RepID=UPI002DE0AF90|nr:alpha-1,6-mannosyltransferase [Lithohypha guttulata]
MSLSRSPSPKPNGGWSSQGLTDNRAVSPARRAYETNGYDGNDAQWAAAQARSNAVRGYPTIQTKNEGYFKRTRRKVSEKLPMFNALSPQDKDWKDQEKLGRGRWPLKDNDGRFATFRTFLGNFLRKFKFLFSILAVVAVVTTVVSQLNVRGRYRSNSRLGGGSKFVIILAANEGGGVMDWKGPREWAIERDSVRNKRLYAERWGYNLEIADMSTKKRYAHEWRESWEKVDIIRNCMAKYPKAEWFWWLDLNTFIMEPSISLQQHIFDDLSQTVYRDINHYNPLNITHPPQSDFLDAVTRSPTGDNLTSSVDMILSQDCGGFNLGSFFVRRSSWSDRLLDIWWDPVLYEQKHMEWEHKEQDALEHIYTSQPHIRTHFGFIEQRKINSFPLAACSKVSEMGEKEHDPRFHYNEFDRDFLVNMAGCEWGRDCWGEMYQYRELSNRLNRSAWRKLVDAVKGRFQRATTEAGKGKGATNDGK